MFSEATLRAVPFDGAPPYTYSWTVTDPTGERADQFLGITNSISAIFRASGASGPYRVSCTMSDSCGRETNADIVIKVGGELGLDITTERFGIMSGGGPLGQTEIRLNPRSGVLPLEVTWTVTGPGGGLENDRLDTSNPLIPIFTSADVVGTYVLTASVIDAVGAKSVESAIVVVGQILGLDVIAERTSVLPGGGNPGKTTLVATPIGGKAPYLYDWEVIGPDGSLAIGLLWDCAVRSPIFESTTESGTFVARCSVTDSTGTVLIGSTSIVVGQEISVDISANRLALPLQGDAGIATTLTADIRGGREPTTMVWTTTGPDGEDASNLLSNTNASETTFTAGTKPGNYIVRLTAVDVDQVSATDSVVLSVGGSMGLFVSTNKTSLTTGGVNPIGVAQLRARVYGGVPPYRYDWSVVAPSGFESTTGLSVPTAESPAFVSTTTIGLHSVICKVIDAEGTLAVGSVRLQVGQPLNLDVTVDKLTLSPGGGVSGQAQLISTLNGGSQPYAYFWTVVGPNNIADPARLSSTTVPNPVFTSLLTTGTYRLTLTTTDVLGVVFVDSAELDVTALGSAGQTLSADVSLNRQTVSPSGGTASLVVTTTGGIAPLNYAWTVTDPSGGTDNTRLSSTTLPSVTFTSNTTQGTYRVRVTVSDALGTSFTDSVQLTVSDNFHIDVAASVTHASPGSAINLSVDRTGGNPNFTYLWTVLNQGGVPTGTFTTGATGTGSATQVAADDATNVWTAPAAGAGVLGSYRVTVLASDSDGNRFTDNVVVTITNAFLMDVTASRTHLAPAGAVNLIANRTGGSPNFTYIWSSVNAAGGASGTFTTGSTGPGSAIQTAADDVTNVWTAPAAAAGTLGTYRITVIATDVDGTGFTDTVEVVVVDPFSINVLAGDPVIAPGAATSVVAGRTGGETTYSYTWTVTNSSGTLAGSFTTGSTGTGAATQTGVVGDATNTWVAPTAGVGVDDTYSILCVATDSLGSVFTDSTQVVVGSADNLTVDLTSTRVHIAPGTLVNLAANQTGGTANYNYTWTATNEAGGSAGTLGAVTQNGVAGDTANTWTAPTIASGVLGTYRITVVATDTLGDSVTDSIHVNVQSPLTLNVTANDTFVAPLTSVSLTANQTGGEPSYSYAWQAVSSGGVNSGTFTTGSTGTGTATQSGLGGNAGNAWSVATEDTYTIICTVTDNDTQVFTDSVEIVITTQSIFSLDVLADRLIVAPGETVNLTGDRTGGAANFSYAWTAVDESNAAAGTLGAANQAGVADDTTNTWIAPAGSTAEGSYRITSTATDAVARAVTDSVLIDVSTLALQNIFLDPVATSINTVLAGTNLLPDASIADPGFQIVAGFTNPVHPRNVVIVITDVNNSITGGTARVNGLDARGLSQSEVIPIAASGGGTSSNTGAAPFAIVTGIDLFAFGGVNVAIDQVQLGVGNKFGLTGRLTAASDLLYVNEAGTVITAGFTFDTTAGQQGITFLAAPDGVRDYVLVFRAR